MQTSCGFIKLLETAADLCISKQIKGRSCWNTNSNRIIHGAEKNKQDHCKTPKFWLSLCPFFVGKQHSWEQGYVLRNRFSENYCIRPNYRTVHLGFSNLQDTLICGQICIYLLRVHYKKDQKRTYIMMTMRFFLTFFTKAYVVGTHLNCIDLSMQFKWVPTTYAFVKK